MRGSSEPAGLPHVLNERMKQTKRMDCMLKVLGGTVGVIFLIGLIVVVGLLMLIF